jgi:hypothetical protein
MEALLAMLLSDKIGAELATGAAATPRNPAADRLRSELQKSMSAE